MRGILLDDTGDLKVSGGTLAVGDTDAQVAELVLEAFPGDYTERPTLGCAVRLMMCGTPDPYFAGRAKSMLESCGVSVKKLVTDREGIILEIND